MKKELDDVTLRQYTPVKKDDKPGPDSAGQSGDDMGLSKDEAAGSESVAELAEEGQFFEAEAVSGLERPYPDEARVRTREVKEDDVPREYPPKDSALDTDDNA
jgi:hypothetical protein